MLNFVSFKHSFISDNSLAGLKLVLWKTFGIIAIVMFCIAGLLFLLANHKEKITKKTKNTLLLSIVSLVIGITIFLVITLLQGLV